MFSAVSSISTGFVPPIFFTPNQLAAIVEDLTAEEIRRGTKLTPAIQIGFEATYYGVQIVLEVTILQEGLSIVLGIPMTTKSSTFDVYRAIPLHQPNEDGTISSVYHSSHEFLAIATNNPQYTELSATTYPQSTFWNKSSTGVQSRWFTFRILRNRCLLFVCLFLSDVLVTANLRSTVTLLWA